MYHKDAVDVNDQPVDDEANLGDQNGIENEDVEQKGDSGESPEAAVFDVTAAGRRLSETVTFFYFEKEEERGISDDDDGHQRNKTIAHDKVELKCQRISHRIQMPSALGRNVVKRDGQAGML